MSESVKHIFASVLLVALLGVIAVAMSGCSSDEQWEDGRYDLDKLPEYFLPGMNGMFFTSAGGERSITMYGIVGEDGVAVKCISSKEIGYFDNIFDYLDEDVDIINVDDYCESLGYEKYPNTSDFFIAFKWVEINTVKDAGQRDGVITVRCSPNPYNQPRVMWVRLQNMKTSVMTVRQESNPDGIDPTD